MDKGQILIVNLGKGRLGADAANVMGGLILTGLRNAAFTREDTPEDQRKPFFISIDEFHNFTSETIAESLAELRKYGIGMTLSQQHSNQSSNAVREALLGNVGSSFIFRLGIEDTSVFTRYLQSPTERDLLNLPNHRAYVRLMIDGVQCRTFTAETLPPYSSPNVYDLIQISKCNFNQNSSNTLPSASACSRPLRKRDRGKATLMTQDF